MGQYRYLKDQLEDQHFIFFVNDLTQLPLRDEITLFADDTTLAVNGKDYKEIVDNVNHDLNLIYDWLAKNRLVLNHKKSNFMVMGRPRAEYDFGIRLFDIQENSFLKRFFDHKINEKELSPNESRIKRPKIDKNE